MEAILRLEPAQLAQLFGLVEDYNLGELSVLKRFPPSKRPLFTGMLNYLRAHIRLQASELEKALSEEGWSASQKSALMGEFARTRSTVERVRNEQRVTDFRWRIDVSLSTNSLSKVLKPEVLVRIRTPTASYQFHMTVRQFTELRRSTAALLRDLQALDQFVFIKSIK